MTAPVFMSEHFALFLRQEPTTNWAPNPLANLAALRALTKKRAAMIRGGRDHHSRNLAFVRFRVRHTGSNSSCMNSNPIVC